MPSESSDPVLNGLSEPEALARLAADGPNALQAARRRSFLTILRDVLAEPMLLLLLGAGGIYLLLGDLGDALVLLAFAGLSIVIELVQEGRTERAIEALRDMTMPQALVIRDGQRRHIPARELVRGDLLVVSEGDRLAGDGWLLRAENLMADEAVLTGESVSVTKRARTAGDVGPLPVPGGENLPAAFAGTLAVRGSGVVEVTATGQRSHMGRIGQSLALLETEAPRLSVQTRRLVRWFALFGMAISLIATLLYGLLRGGWLEAALAGIALAMSMLPEEFPVVLALFLTMGALRMARARVLARRGSAIETLGAATVLCTDKTGTLTQNRMAIAELRLPDGRTFAPGAAGALVIPEAFVELAGLGILACLEQPFDPMETAFHDLGARHEGADLGWRQKAGWTLHRQYGLHPELLAVSHVWGDGQDSPEDEHIVAAKGAPEAIARLCGMTDAERAALDAEVSAMAAGGLRVLGVAEARWTGEELPETQQHFTYAFRGLVGLADPIRETVPDAVRALQQAGVRVVMITGDYPVTARAIATSAGIVDSGVLTGAELEALDDEALAARVGRISVFARVMPQQKLRIVQALKAAGEIVAMTGDGVNDAPSLKAAHIGVAMGKRGTDVAREASAIVLLDDDFGAIPQAVRLGRRIFDNLRKAMGFILCVHLPIGALALAPLITGWPIILGPMHIAMLEMIIDPVCSLAFEAEPEERDIMRRPPRDPAASLIPRRLVAWSLIQGTLAAALLIGLLAWTQAQPGMAEEQARAIAFAGIVAAVLVLIRSNRSFGRARIVGFGARNLPLAVIVALVSAGALLLVVVPPLAALFRFAAPGVEGIAAVALLALVLLVLLGALKPRFRDALAG